MLRAHLEFLADDALEGRRPGTRGGELAAKYIAAQFERLGLEPAGDSGSYYHHVPIITLTPNPTLKVLGSTPSDLAYRDDYVLWSMRNDSTVKATGDLVFVGYGIVAPEYNWDDYKGLDVKNKIVVVLVNDPGLRDSTIFRGAILTYYGRWTYKIEEAQRQGAAGILLVHTTESATYPWTTVKSSWTGPQVRIESPSHVSHCCRLAESGGCYPDVPPGRAGPELVDGPGRHPPVPRGSPRPPGRSHGAKRDHPVGNQQCHRPSARTGPSGARGGSDRGAL